MSYSVTHVYYRLTICDTTTPSRIHVNHRLTIREKNKFVEKTKQPRQELIHVWRSLRTAQPLCVRSHTQKRVRQIKKKMVQGLLDPEKEDIFSLFVAGTDISYCYYHESERILGRTFGMCVLQVIRLFAFTSFPTSYLPYLHRIVAARFVCSLSYLRTDNHQASRYEAAKRPIATSLMGNEYTCTGELCIVPSMQDFEGVTPNLLARTMETVEGGGIVVLLLSTMASLRDLYTLTMDVHKRLQTPSHQTITGKSLHTLSYLPG
jgi:tRNA(Met) C34 N-acetyltransferase TmcA